MYRVCVLMSTYNGELFLSKQIDTILEQVNVDVHLLVRDDGSSDSTVEILEKYTRNNKLKIYHDECNLGPAHSFMKLLYEAGDYDYYAFADQDDIWLKDKLFVAISMIKKYDNIPSLYCSNQWIYIDGRNMGLRFSKKQNLGLVQAICGNEYSGCTMLFNKKLASILKDEANRPDIGILKIRMHDTWVIAVAQYIGKVIYDDNSYINYRIHNNNTVGLKKNKFKRLTEKIINPNLRDGRSKFAKELLKIKNVDQEKKNIVKAFAEKDKKYLLRKSIVSNTNDRHFIIKTLFGVI